jgi:phage shock protein A
VAFGAQCKGERHEQTIGRQREALNELRARIKSLEQLRPANPSYEKVLQQVVLLKRELAELRARQALPNDIPYLTTTPGSTSNHQQSQRQSATIIRQSPSGSNTSGQTPEVQKIIEERTAHAETINSLQSCDELVSLQFYKQVKQWGILYRWSRIFG